MRVLDVGCGTGRLLALLASELAPYHRQHGLELYGLDVGDHGVQRSGFMDRTIDFLTATHPDHPWPDRVHLIGESDAWPFPSDFFHVIVSNQVLEHVRDHTRFLREVRRTLRADGVSAHLFPLRHCVYEAHLNLPLVHRIRSAALMRAYIRACSRIGLGKFRRHRRASGVTLDEFVDRHANYVRHLTNYVTQRQIVRLARVERFRVSFRYSPGFYTTKLRTFAGLAAPRAYRADRSETLDSIAVLLLRYISSITLVLEKADNSAL
jgi:SAM-dependent methyltransferase